MKVLHVLPSVDPKAGGPRENVRNLGSRMRELGHDWQVVSLDAPSDVCVQEFPLPVHAVGPSQGKYRFNRNLVPWLKSNAARFDAVIVNGIWQFHSFAAWLALHRASVPYYVFTHGMLDPWFKHEYPLKHLKKWAYWPWADYRLLRDARTVFFTSAEERTLARTSFWLYRAKEKVLPYGTRRPPGDAQRLSDEFRSRYPAVQGRRVILFLGRIHEKKGCDLLIEAFAQVALADRSLCLVMAGPDETGWVVRLKATAAKHGVSDRIVWTGMLSGDLKWGAYYSAEAFALPSHQENFGIAVAEALGCGVPVLISNRVNIWREIQEDRCGVVGADTLAGTLDSLRTWMALTDDERQQMRTRALDTFLRRFTIEAMGDALLSAIATTGGAAGQPVLGLANE